MTRRPAKRSPRAPAGATPTSADGSRAALPHGSGLDPDLRELRSAIANLRAAAEALGAAASSPSTRAARGTRKSALLQAVIEESERASRAVDALARSLREAGSAYAASAVSVERLAAEIARRAAAELDLLVHTPASIDVALTVPPVFAGSILGALGRLRRDFGVGEVELSARRHADLLALDIAFAAREPEASRLREDHHRVLAGGLRGEPALGDEARAAGGEAWLAIRRGEPRFSLRLLLPLSAAA